MSPRLLVTSALLLAATSARAEVHLDVGGGYGVAAHDPCAYPAAQCEAPVTRAFGAAPLVVAGVRGHGPGTSYRLRYGGTASALFVPASSIGTTASANVVAGAGEIGVEHGPWSLDMTAGFARIAVTDANTMTHARSGAFSFGYVLGLRVAPQWTVVARADGFAVMHGDSAAGFIGAGVAWSPR